MLYILRNVILFFHEFLNDLPKILISGFGIVFLISSVIITISLKKSSADFLRSRVFGNLDINQIKISKSEKTEFLNTKAGGSEISSNIVNKIDHLDGLTEVHKLIRLNSPARLKAGILGMYVKTDMLISGIDSAFFKNNFKNWKDFGNKDELPVIIPAFVMDLYNNFATSNRLPALGPGALKLLTMEITLGSSSFSGNHNDGEKYKLKLFGFTDKIISAGIIVPVDFINDFCKKNNSDCSCIMIYAKVKEVKDIPALTKKIKSMGLTVESHADIAEKTEKALFILNAILFSVTGLILLLTVFAVFNSYLTIVYNKHQKISVQRMLGASKLRIILTFTAESGIIGVLYGLIGYFLGSFVLKYITDNISELMPALTGINLKIALFTYLPQLLAFSAGVSILSAIIPAVFAANLNLFNAVKK